MVKILEKKGNKLILVDSLLTMGLAVVTLIFAFTIWDLDVGTLGPTQYFQLTVLIIGGFVLPGIMFALSFLADRQILKFKLHNLIFGIVTITLATIIIIVDVVMINSLILLAEAAQGDSSGSYYIGVLVCLYLGIITNIICAYGGAQNVMAHLKND